MIVTKSRKDIAYIALLVVPLLYLILLGYSGSLHGKYYQAYFTDPSYAYLMNSLNIVNGELPGHTDHPGTTIQLLGGLVIKVNGLIGNNNGAVNNITLKVLQNPEDYIKQICNLLISIIAIAVFIFGFQVYRETKNVGLAIISQAFPLTFSTLLQQIPRLHPEPLLVASSFLLAATLVPIVTGNSGNTPQRLRATLTGTIVGIGIVTKVTFVPLILFLMIFQGKKAKLLAVIAFITTVIILTIPIWESIPKMMDWLMGLLTHSGRYGHGEKGLPSMSFLLTSAVNLFRATPILFCFIPLLIGSLFIARKNAQHSRFILLHIISLSVLICSFAITIKHPSPRYLMPVIGLSGFWVLIIIWSCSRKYMNLFVALIAIICVLGVYKAIEQTEDNLVRYQKKHDDLLRLQELAQQYGCRSVSYYRSSSQAYALQFGNDFARRIYHRELKKLYPKYVSYNIWSKRLTGFQGSLSQAEVSSFLENPDPICFTGTVSLSNKGHPSFAPLGKKGKFTLYQLLEFNGISLTRIMGKEER